MSTHIRGTCVCVSVCQSACFVWNCPSSCPPMPVCLWVDVYEVRSLPVSLVFYTTIQLHRSYCNSLHLRASLPTCSGCTCPFSFVDVAMVVTLLVAACLNTVTCHVMLALFPIIWGFIRLQASVAKWLDRILYTWKSQIWGATCVNMLVNESLCLLCHLFNSMQNV